MTLGEKITELRKKFNLTQEKLSNQIGVSRQTLSNWESDITSPDITQAKSLAKIFKISLDDLTNTKTEVQCTKNKSILNNLISKECCLDVDDEDYRLMHDTICKIIDINKDFVKIEFKHQKNIITKLIDMNLVSSIRYIEEENNK